MPRKSERLYDAIGYIRPIHQLSAQLVTSQLAGGSITMPMRAILERLVEDGPRTVPQLAGALWITRQGVQRIVDEAKDLGYVETRTNPEHKRSHLIALTDRGSAAYRSLHGDELVRMDDIAAGLDSADIDACVRVLAHLTSELRTLVHADEDR